MRETAKIRTSAFYRSPLGLGSRLVIPFSSIAQFLAFRRCDMGIKIRVRVGYRVILFCRGIALFPVFYALRTEVLV